MTKVIAVILQNQFIRFLCVGGVATACHYVLLIFLVEILSVNAVFASFCGAFLGAIISYVLNYRLTFNSSRPHRSALPRFLAVAFLSLVLNTGLMALFVQKFNFAYLPSQIVTTLLLIIVTFGANKIWTFNETSIKSET